MLYVVSRFLLYIPDDYDDVDNMGDCDEVDENVNDSDDAAHYEYHGDDEDWFSQSLFFNVCDFDLVHFVYTLHWIRLFAHVRSIADD